MKISVIMLTYNRDKFITRAIESIIRQSIMDYEVIIVDNGSTDNSGKIADQYADKYKNIYVEHIKRSSIGKGRNVGLNAAKGEYIAFVDDDDLLKPDMLEFLYNLIIEHNADISICGTEKIINGARTHCDINDEKLIMNASEAVVELLKRKKYNAGLPTKMIKKDIFEVAEFRENTKYDDIFVTYKYIANAKRVVYSGVPKYIAVRHNSNNSSFTLNDLLITPAQLNEYFDAFRERTKYISCILPDIADYVRYSEWSYMISMCNKIEKNNLTKCSEQLDFIKMELTEHYDEFYNSPYIEEFEKKWMMKYIFISK